MRAGTNETQARATTSKRSRLRRTMVVAALACAAMLALAITASAATFTVTNTDDSGPGSLRQAIIDANGNSAEDTIEINATGQVDLQSELPDLEDDNAAGADLTIDGPGMDDFTVRRDAGGDYRIFTVSADAEVAIEGLTATNGAAGGVLTRDDGALTLTGVEVSGNSGTSVSGINVNVGGQLTLRESAVIDNSSTSAGVGGGGGIDNNGGTLVVEDSTISGNSVTGANGSSGGGIFSSTGTSTTLRNTTVSGNDAETRGGGLSLGGTAELDSVTLASNTANDGSNLNASDTTTIENTIVADPQGSSENCNEFGSGTITSQGHNLEDGTDCGFTQASDQQNADPDLGPLADNGGPTETRALGSASDAIDQGETELAEDQRGVSRPQGAEDDVGAFELQLPSADLSLKKSDSPDPVTNGDQVTYTIDVDNPTGGDDATNVVVTDDLPSSVAYDDGASDSRCDETSPGQVECDLATLAAGASDSVEIVVTTQSSGTVTNDASVDSDTDDPDTANNSDSEDTTVDPSADLRVNAVARNAVDDGDRFNYRVKAVNRGPDTADNPVLRIRLSDGQRFLRASDGCEYRGSKRVVVCRLPDMADGAERTRNIRVQATEPGRISATAIVRSKTDDPGARNNRDIERVSVRSDDSGSGSGSGGGGRPACTITGTSRNDVIRGTSGDDVICAGAGNDVVRAGGGDDIVYGGQGNDVLRGGPGADRLYGEGGPDTVSSSDGVRGNDLVDGGGGSDRCDDDQGDTRRNCP